MRMRICVSDLGFTKAKGRHFWQIAIESPEEESARISLMGRMRVDEMGVARWGDLTMIRERSSEG
jgi:hypothetical protein